MPKRNDRYENAYSNRSAYYNSNNSRNERYERDDLSGTRVFGSQKPARYRNPQPPRRERTRNVKQGVSLAAVNVSLTVVIIALAACLTVLVSIYSQINS